MKLCWTLFAFLTASAVTQAADKAAFVTALEGNKPQTIVTYGTSLTAGGEWPKQLQLALGARFPKLATVVNSGSGGQWSTWGVKNLDERVIAKQPDVVLIEFSINDAFLPYQTSVDDARANLTHMIDRIHAVRPQCEVILMVMNPPIGEHLERRPKIADYEQMYRDFAAKKKLRLIDHAPGWQAVLKKGEAEYRKLVPDGIHPNGTGCAEIITPNILQEIGLKVAD
ncbi:MAG: SGNH/GDSL hydrolase family protein [Planctomycetes bacterium]|nr:SGNH/GDSL hydrolase family protein [Planctomycetota bacterium]